jgi:2-(1,2-epoxy-1,2-dihydrophenyl)acetyl-CoA isomerase
VVKMKNETVQIEVSEGVATLLLNRPNKLNALDRSMAWGLEAATRQLADDPAVRCVIIAGAGDHFQAGGDIEYFRAMLNGDNGERQVEVRDIINKAHAAIVNLRSMPKPVVASVRGAVAGFGISLLAACDMAIAAEGSSFSLAYCHIGTSPDGGATYALPRMVGMKRAMELALLGDHIDATHAETIGLVNRVVGADELDDTVAQLARRLTRGPGFAYAKTKVLLNASWNNDLEAQLEAEADSFVDCVASEDFAAGVNAFCEKRTAEFTGR